MEANISLCDFKLNQVFVCTYSSEQRSEIWRPICPLCLTLGEVGGQKDRGYSDVIGVLETIGHDLLNGKMN